MSRILHMSSNSNFSTNCLARMDFHTIFEFCSISAFRIWFQILSITLGSGPKMDLKKTIFWDFWHMWRILHMTSNSNFSANCLARMDSDTIFEFCSILAFRIWFQILSITFGSGPKMDLKKTIFWDFWHISWILHMTSNSNFSTNFLARQGARRAPHVAEGHKPSTGARKKGP